MCDLLTVCTNDNVGRYAKISKSVKAGENILTDTPFVVGPKSDSPLCCLGCYKYIEEVSLCEKCRWPVCSAECSNRTWHSNYECRVFTSAGITFNVDGDPGPQLECITPLRALLAREKDDERWAKLVSPLMDHNELRRENKEFWDAEKNNVVDFLRTKCKLSNKFSEESIRKVCGILEVNSYEIIPDVSAVPIRGIYPKASIPSHNCVCNTTHSISPEDFTMTVRATVDIPEGSEVFTSYTSSLDPTMIRRAALKTSKYFECDCERCKDPKELGSHLSSIKCPSCDNGLIMSPNPLDVSAEWNCSHCDKKLSGELVQRLYLKIQSELAELEYMEIGPEKLEFAEKVLRQYKSSLHPRHAFNCTLHHILSQLYGRVDGYTMDMLPDVLLERKAQFCQQLLDTLSIVEPGMTRMRGRLLFELHVAQLMMTRTKFQLQVISSDKFKKEIHDVISLLEESAKILSLEPEGSPDRILAQTAKDSINQLEASLVQTDSMLVNT